MHARGAHALLHGAKMLVQEQVEVAAAELVAALAYLHCDELPRHFLFFAMRRGVLK